MKSLKIDTNISKKQVIFIMILVINVVFVTVPYSIKNHKMQKILRNQRRITKIQKTKNIDLYEKYDEFNDILEQNKIKPISKKAKFEKNSLEIKLVLDSNVEKVIDISDIITKKIPNIKLSYANISDNNKENEVVFYLSDTI